MTVVLRTTTDPLAVVPAFRTIVSEIDPSLALANVRALNEVRDAAMGRERFLAHLLFAFAAVGFALALVGVYGVMAHIVRGRRREMGIRLALGSTPGAVCWQVVRRSAQLSAIGVAIGVVMSLLVSQAIRTLLFGIPTFDPVSFSVVPFVLTVSALAAGLIPALAASRANPTDVLRME
jgi:ABC-type antimicrobial peptide transport system permease subunit